MLNLALAVNLHQLLHRPVDIRSSLLAGLCIAASPLHFFFANLFYTDVVSLTLVLGSHILAQKNHIFWCSLLGAGAVMIRQTNIVWICFILFDVIVADLGLHGSNCRRLRESILCEMQLLYAEIVHRKVLFLRKFWTVPILPLSFLYFAITNGGIVVGDRKAHTPVVHTAQLGYFSIFLFGSMAPIFLERSSVRGVYTMICRRFAISFLFFAACVSILFWGTFVHPYTVADNRHFTFYLWKRYLSKEWIRLSLSPVMAYTCLAVFHSLGRNRSHVWFAAFWVCVAATIVPAGLLELR